MAEETQTPAPQKPVLQVVGGQPTDEEVAALTVLFSALTSGGDAKPERKTNLWGNPEDRLRRPLSYSPSSFQNVQFY